MFQVLNALEELALNFDTKAQEAEAKERENDQLNEDLQKKTLELHEARAELDTLREAIGVQKRKLNDYVNNMLKELQEVDGAIKVCICSKISVIIRDFRNYYQILHF